MRRTNGVWLAALLAVCSGAVGCETAAGDSAVGQAAGSSAAPPKEFRRIELLSFWRPFGNSDPVKTLIQQHQRAHPEDIVTETVTPQPAHVRKTILARIYAGEPPDVFQSNLGRDHMQWVLMNGYNDQESKLMPISDVNGALIPWRRAVPESLIAPASFGPKLYGIPMTVHRVNVLYFNKRVFEAHGLDPPTTLEALLAAGKRLKAKGIPLLAMDTQQPWHVLQLALECLLIAREGPDFYTRYLQGGATADDPRMVQTLHATLDLLRYSTSSRSAASWLDAARLVANGEAAAIAMGDWLGVLFADSPDVVEIPFPGTENVFGATADVFSVPADARNRAGAQRLLTTFASIEVQRTLVKVKGCLSPRTDVNSELTDPVQREKARLLANGRVVLAVSGMAPKQFNDDLAWALLEMMRLGDVDPVLHTLRSRYCLLSNRVR